jgi:hypothetical protein
MRHYCTYFDRNFLLRGLALYRSLEAHAAPLRLWVLCLDDFTYDALARLERANLRPVRLSELEADDPALLAVKPTRSRVEYFFTCSPSWPRYLLRRYPAIDLITYLDADLYFYASPEPIFEELGDNSILIIGHRFPEALRHKEIYGVYNVGFLSFRNDRRGLECLDWWRERCLEWCYDQPEAGRFADQKYLDDWPHRFEGVTVLQHKGANLAPWNWRNYTLSLENGQARVDGQPLIFFHFHGFKVLSARFFEPVAGVESYGVMPRCWRVWFYCGYVEALREAARWVRQVAPDTPFGGGNVRAAGYPWHRWPRLMLRWLQGRVMLSSDLK